MEFHRGYINPRQEFIDQVKTFASNEEGSPAYLSLVKRLRNNELKLTPQTIYVAARANSTKSLVVTEEGKNKLNGIRSLTGNKLDAGFFFMPIAIQVLAADSITDDLDATLQAAEFTHIEDIDPAIPNGDFSLSTDSTLFLDRLSLQAFANKGGSFDKPGMYYLTNSVIFKEDTELKIEMKGLPSVPDIGFKVVLHGIGSRP